MIELLEVPLQGLPRQHEDRVDGIILKRTLGVERQKVLLKLKVLKRKKLKIITSYLTADVLITFS